MIQSGDTCQVINGLGRTRSPNIGLHVKVVSLQGEHSQLGRIWRCSGHGVKQLTDTGQYEVTGWADFPASWLQKIEPNAPANTTTTTKETNEHH